ncbi:MAG: hypothetical protein Q8Q15_00745 [bacterium]|nr:hypothetical protein [bacterium]
MGDQKSLRVFGVVCFEEKNYLFVQSSSSRTAKFQVYISENGKNFRLLNSNGEIKTHKGNLEKVLLTSDWLVARLGPLFLLTYCKLEGGEKQLAMAYSSDLINWQKISTRPLISQSGMVVPNYQYNDKTVLFFGEHDLKIAESRDLQNWQINHSPVLTLDTEQTRGGRLKIVDITVTKKHLLVFYFFIRKEPEAVVYSLRVAFFDKNNPYQHHHENHHVIWYQRGGWVDFAVPIGLVRYKQILISFWQNKKNKILALKHEDHLKFLEELEDKSNYPLLRRLSENPILKPIADHWWESSAVFNPAAVKDNNKIHLVYRAVGDTSESMLGYASSRDGINFDERLTLPIFGTPDNLEDDQNKATPYCSLQFISGGAGSWRGLAGGNGGCEDPRLTKIDDRFYLIYVVYTGWSEPRLAMTSIKEEDFNQHLWRWRPPVYISRPGEIDKSGCLLPEKVNGKYVIFHRVFPDILIDFVDDLNQFNGRTWLKGEYRIHRQEDSWDSRKVCVGATPIKTSDGWLVIYNAVNDLNDRIYQIGAMLLDKNDPTKVLFRCKNPILSAEAHYENNGLKYGVAYACGAVEHNNNLLVYYGGSDQFVCAAQSPMEEFLTKLKNTGLPQLQPFIQSVKILN